MSDPLREQVRAALGDVIEAYDASLKDSGAMARVIGRAREAYNAPVVEGGDAVDGPAVDGPAACPSPQALPPWMEPKAVAAMVSEWVSPDGDFVLEIDEAVAQIISRYTYRRVSPTPAEDATPYKEILGILVALDTQERLNLGQTLHEKWEAAWDEARDLVRIEP